jgi:hypothetical protein
MEESYCKKCKKHKKIDKFYKSNLSQCKNCRKKITKSNNFTKNEVSIILENLYNKINSMELLYKELFNKNNEIINTVLLFMDKRIKDENSIIDTFNNIQKRDEKINDNMETIINFRNKIVFDDKYENTLKEVLEE